MPTILLKKSDTASAVPTTANLTNLAGGVEVAVNTADRRMFTMTSASAVVELGTNPSSLTCADASFTVARVGSLTISSLSLTNATFASATITNLTSTSATISSALTLSGGTANGVLYLNGSKVATSGSALTFDGSTLTNTGNSTGTVANTIVNTDAAGSSITDERIVFAMGGSLGFGVTGWANAGIVEAASTGGLYLGAFNGPINFASGASARNINMTLSAAGNLGIGTASPAAKLHVAGESIILDRSVGDPFINFYTGGSTTNVLLYAGSSTGFRVFTSGTERLRVDTSGNLGLGVTPSAWNTGALQIRNASFWGLSGSPTFSSVGANYYYDGTYKYISTAQASDYYQFLGQHVWRTAASGTAGNAITFTSAMTLDASGNLGIGTTSPVGRLRLAGSSANVFPNKGANLWLTDTNAATSVKNWALASDAGAYKLITGSDDVTAGELAYQATRVATSTQVAEHIFYTGASAERMRIDSSGNVGIGTSNPGDRLDVVGGNIRIASGNTVRWVDAGNIRASIQGDSSSNAIFSTAGSERMRITSGGNLLVGTTTDLSGVSGNISDINGNVRNIPRSGSAKTSTYTLAITDVGEYIELGTGGGIDVPNGVFSTGNAVSVFNNTTGARTISLTITTAYIAGTDADKNSVTLATRGLATILFISNSVCVVSGNVS